MARKQTLRSLLGSGGRVQTDLALDEVSFSAPRIQAGKRTSFQPVCFSVGHPRRS